MFHYVSPLHAIFVLAVRALHTEHRAHLALACGKDARVMLVRGVDMLMALNDGADANGSRPTVAAPLDSGYMYHFAQQKPHKASVGTTPSSIPNSTGNIAA